MFEKIFELFDSADQSATGFTRDDLPLAAAVLLVEVARSDYERGAVQDEHLVRLLRNAFDLDTSEVDELLQRAEAEADVAVSLDKHVVLLNRHYAGKEKTELVRDLWEVALVDGELHHYEEHLVRRLADLLRVPHREFIKAKHRAARRL